jgi:septum formation protein
MIILASKSTIRSHILSQAGVSHIVRVSDFDETPLQNSAPPLPSNLLASRLAQAKAENLARQWPRDLVIGADQTLELEGKTLHKSADISSARQTLQQLSDKTHILHSALSVMKADHVLFSFTGKAHLTMRHFTSDFLDQYIKTEGDDILHAVGCYKLEGRGLQLFDKIEGDYFTILGLPMLPLLAFLRQIGELPS